MIVDTFPHESGKVSTIMAASQSRTALGGRIGVSPTLA
jgi:hypothetical protein